MAVRIREYKGRRFRLGTSRNGCADCDIRNLCCGKEESDEYRGLCNILFGVMDERSMLKIVDKPKAVKADNKSNNNNNN